VTVALRVRNEATVENVLCYVHRRALKIAVEGLGVVTGDVAWGGNWFFLTGGAPYAIERANIPRLNEAALAVRAELARAGHRGRDGGEIDHIDFSFAARAAAPTTVTLFYVLAAPTIAPLAAPGRAPNSPALPLRAHCRRARHGSRGRRLSSAIPPTPFPTASPFPNGLPGAAA
jgi:proline racemase